MNYNKEILLKTIIVVLAFGGSFFFPPIVRSVASFIGGWYAYDVLKYAYNKYKARSSNG